MTNEVSSVRLLLLLMMTERLGRSYLVSGSRTSLGQVPERMEGSPESSYYSDTSGESGSEEEGEEGEMERRMWRLKKRRVELKESLSDCWNTVKDKVEFAEHGEFISVD